VRRYRHAAELLNRPQQIKEALTLLDPPPPEREACRQHVEFALDYVESTGRVAEHPKITKKSIGAYSAALRRMQTASNAYVHAGGALALRVIDQAVAFNKAWGGPGGAPPRGGTTHPQRAKWVNSV
jgi:hypothetical protein